MTQGIKLTRDNKQEHVVMNIYEEFNCAFVGN